MRVSTKKLVAELLRKEVKRLSNDIFQNAHQINRLGDSQRELKKRRKEFSKMIQEMKSKRLDL